MTASNLLPTLPMARGSSASLSRIGNGGAKVGLLRAEDRRRLVELGLAMISKDRAALTEIGRRRLDKLQRTAEPKRKVERP